MLQWDFTVCCSVLQCVVVYCSVLHCVAVCYTIWMQYKYCGTCSSVLQCVAVRCSALQYFVVLHNLQSPGYNISAGRACCVFTDFVLYIYMCVYVNIYIKVYI